MVSRYCHPLVALVGPEELYLWARVPADTRPERYVSEVVTYLCPFLRFLLFPQLNKTNFTARDKDALFFRSLRPVPILIDVPKLLYIKITLTGI